MKKIVILAISSLFCLSANAQFFAVKGNAVSWATGTVNAGVEFSVGKQWSVDLSGY